MESIQEQLIREIEKTPNLLLQQILDFAIFLNQKYRSELSRPIKGWQPGFFEEVIGGWEGEKLFREPQADYEVREELR